MANAPGFDPNDPGAADADDRGNRAVGEIFEPGSTSKVITIAAALEEGVVAPTTPFEVADTIVRGGSRFKDSHPHAVEQLTMAGMLAESSNVGTILAGEALSNEQLHAWFGAFGYGQPTGLGLPGESPGLLADPADWSGLAALHRDVRPGRAASTRADRLGLPDHRQRRRARRAVGRGRHPRRRGRPHARAPPARPSGSSPPRPPPRCATCSSRP